MDFATPTIRLPQPPSAPPSRRIPIVAAIAPVLVSLVLFAVTGSPLTLLFAMLGPVTAIASLADGAIGARRHVRRERSRFDREGAEALESIGLAHGREIAALRAATPSGSDVVAGDPRATVRWRSPPDIDSLTIGDGSVRSAVRVDGGGAPELAELVAAAATLTAAPILADPAGGIGVVGALPIARAVARGIVIQALAMHPPDRVTIVADGPAWATATSVLPYDARPGRAGEADSIWRLESRDRGVPADLVRIEVADDPLALAATCATIVTIDGRDRETGQGNSGDVGAGAAIGCGASVRRVGHHGERALLVRPVDVLAFNQWCAAVASLPQQSGGGEPLPELVGLDALLAARPAGAVAGVLGVGSEGPVTVDLEHEGPHAVIGGTTGSGKSELLLTWIASMAWGASPEDLAVLLVDFKGGAGFAPIAGLPHVVGIVTDLDEAGAMRAVGSLRAELRRREGAIAAAGLREHRGGIGLPRLVIVVDEYAALMDADPALHAVFGDLAARGRSLGIHLIVGTQRPSASVRDAVLANADVRLCLRVRDRADAIALVGIGAPAELPAHPRGRAVGSAGGSPAAPLQVATVDRSTIDRIERRWANAPRPARPWRDPLPASITAAALPALLDPAEFMDPAGRSADDDLTLDRARGGIIGVIDRPDEQRIVPWHWSARREGMLLAVGASGCGRTGLATAIAAVGPSIWVPTDAAIAWDQVLGLAEANGDHGGVTLVIDDLDLVADRFEPEHRQVWLDALTRLCRRRRELGIGIAVTAASIDGPIRMLEPHAATRVLMRLPSRQDHRLAGGDAESWDARLPPGGAVVDGRRAQVLDVVASAHELPEVRSRRLGDGRVVVIAADPGAVVSRLSADGRPVLPVADALNAAASLPSGVAIVGDAAAWQSRWDALETLSAGAQVLVHGLPLSTMRAVTGRRDLPPPLPAGPEWCWLLAPGRVLRSRLP